MKTLLRPGTRHILCLCLFGLLGALTILIVTSRYGAGITPDSVAYISAAQSLAAGKGFLLYDNRPFVDYAPLLPSLLGLLAWVGLDPVHAARYIHAFCFGGIVVIAIYWILTYVQSRLIRSAGMISALLSFPVVYVSAFVWSEPLFILSSLLCLTCAARHLQTQGKTALAYATVFAAMACLTRYIGFALVLGVSVALLSDWTRPVIQRVRSAALFVSVSLLPITVWLIRNYHVSSTWMGERGISPYTPAQVISMELKTTSLWLLPERIPTFVRVSVVLVVALFLLITFVRLNAVSFTRKPSESRTSPVLLLMAFVVSFVSLHAISAMRTLVDIDNRNLAPIYLPALLLVLAALDTSMRNTSVARYAASRYLALILPVWLLFPLGRTAAFARGCLDNGAELRYASSRFRDTRLAWWLRNNPLNGPVFSNDPELLWLYKGIVTQGLPRKQIWYGSSKQDTKAIREFLASVKDQTQFYVIWFNGRRSFLYHPADFRSYFNLRAVAVFPESVIYEARPLVGTQLKPSGG